MRDKERDEENSRVNSSVFLRDGHLYIHMYYLCLSFLPLDLKLLRPETFSYSVFLSSFSPLNKGRKC